MQRNYPLNREHQLTNNDRKGVPQFFWLALLAGLLSTNCTAPRQVAKVSQEVQNDTQQGDSLLKGLRQPPRPRTILHNEPWVAKKTIQLLAPRLPDQVNCDITFATVEPMPTHEFSRLINKLCGVPVRITADAQEMLSVRAASSRDPDAQHLSKTPMIAGIHWQGKLEGLLDEVSASLGLHWRYHQHAISLYYLDTRTFQLHAFPSETKVQTSVGCSHDAGGGKGSSGNSGQSSQSTSTSLKSNLVQDMHNTIRSMLTKKVSQLSLSPSTGSVTVTDTPEVLERIANYVKHENHTITKQVLINIKVLTVVLKNSAQLGIDWKLVYSSGPENKTKAVNLTITPNESTQDCTSSILKITSGSGPFTNSELVLKALASQGKVSVVTSPSVTTLNLQPVPVQVATQVSYLARTEVTKTETSTSVQLTPGTITHGFNMDLIPFVMADNQLLLQYTINSSELLELTSFSIGNEKDGDKSTIQLPQLSTRLFSQKVKLLSGETLVLSGFEKIKNDSTRRGLGSKHNWLLGGTINADQERTIIVLMITPIVMVR